MKIRIIGILVVLFVVLANLSYAEDCFNTDVSIKNNDAQPGDTLTVKLEVGNNYSNDIKEDVDVNLEVDDMDDGDTYSDDGTIDYDDINDNEGKIEFEVPVSYYVDKGEHDITIKLEGITKNGTRCQTTINSSVNIKKDSHSIIMNTPVVSQETLKCSRTTEASITMYNIGRNDEDVDLEVYNTDLGIDQKETFSLNEGSDSDIRATKTIYLNLKDAEAGAYTFFVKASYGNEETKYSFKINVQDCPAKNTTVNPIVPAEVKKEVSIQEYPMIPAIVADDKTPFLEQYGLLILAYSIVVIVGILLIISLLRKR